MRYEYAWSLLAIGGLLLMATTASADLFDLSPEHYPRAHSIGLTVTYDADGGTGGNGLLTAYGAAPISIWQLFLCEEDPPLNMKGTFDLWAEIDPASGTAVSASLTLDGDPYGSMQGLFYSQELTAFGYGGDDILQFKFIQDGDMVAPDGAVVGVLLYAVSIDDDKFGQDVLPSWLEDFDNNGNGTSETFYVPEPCTAAMLALGALTVLRRRT